MDLYSAVQSAVQLLPYTTSWEAKNCTLMLIHHLCATVGSESTKGRSCTHPVAPVHTGLEERGTSGVTLPRCQTPSPRRATQALGSAANTWLQAGVTVGCGMRELRPYSGVKMKLQERGLWDPGPRMFYKGLRGLQGSVVQGCSTPGSNCTPQLPSRPWLYSSPRALLWWASMARQCLKSRCCMPPPAQWGEEECGMMVCMAQRAASVQPCCHLPLPQACLQPHLLGIPWASVRMRKRRGGVLAPHRTQAVGTQTHWGLSL